MGQKSRRWGRNGARKAGGLSRSEKGFELESGDNKEPLAFGEGVMNLSFFYIELCPPHKGK